MTAWYNEYVSARKEKTSKESIASTPEAAAPARFALIAGLLARAEFLKRFNMRKAAFIALGIVGIGGVVFSISLYNQLAAIKNDPQKFVREEVRRVLAGVLELVSYPEDPGISVATLTDLETFNDPFFAQGNIGDKIVLFPNKGRVVLYDPDAHRIVDIAPYTNLAPNNSTPNAQSTPVLDDSEE